MTLFYVNRKETAPFPPQFSLSGCVAEVASSWQSRVEQRLWINTVRPFSNDVWNPKLIQMYDLPSLCLLLVIQPNQCPCGWHTAQRWWKPLASEELQFCLPLREEKNSSFLSATDASADGSPPHQFFLSKTIYRYLKFTDVFMHCVWGVLYKAYSTTCSKKVPVVK